MIAIFFFCILFENGKNINPSPGFSPNCPLGFLSKYIYYLFLKIKYNFSDIIYPVRRNNIN